MPERRCDRCGRPLTTDATQLAIGGALKTEVRVAEICGACGREWFLPGLEHFHQTRQAAAVTYRRSGK